MILSSMINVCLILFIRIWCSKLYLSLSHKHPCLCSVPFSRLVSPTSAVSCSFATLRWTFQSLESRFHQPVVTHILTPQNRYCLPRRSSQYRVWRPLFICVLSLLSERSFAIHWSHLHRHHMGCPCHRMYFHFPRHCPSSSLAPRQPRPPPYRHLNWVRICICGLLTFHRRGAAVSRFLSWYDAVHQSWSTHSQPLKVFLWALLAPRF